MGSWRDAVCGESIVWIWCGMTDRRETRIVYGEGE